MINQLYKKIIPTIEENQTFIISSHSSPDCDALGSELALAEHLRNIGKQVTIINTDKTNAVYQFLDPHSYVKIYTPNKHDAIIKEAQVIIVVDASGGWKRLGKVGETLSQAGAIKICIDHHPNAADFVDITAIDINAAATAELIYDVIMAMNGTLSENMAQALYTGIMTDTGSFRFPKTTPRTHNIISRLLSEGANPLSIYSNIHEQNSLNLVRLKGHVANTIQTEAGGQIAYYGLKRYMMKDYGVKSSELAGFSSIGQSIKGVRVVIFYVEKSKKQVKISLRSNGTVPINQIAISYGGGGHRSAAGATITGKVEDIMAELIKKVKLALSENPL